MSLLRCPLVFGLLVMLGAIDYVETSAAPEAAPEATSPEIHASAERHTATTATTETESGSLSSQCPSSVSCS